MMKGFVEFLTFSIWSTSLLNKKAPKYTETACPFNIFSPQYIFMCFRIQNLLPEKTYQPDAMFLTKKSEVLQKLLTFYTYQISRKIFVFLTKIHKKSKNGPFQCLI